MEEIGQGLAVDSEIRVVARRPMNRDALSRLPGVRSVSGENGSATLEVQSPAQAVTAIVRYLDSENNELVDIAVMRPTLEDVFLKVTGERLSGEED